MALMPAVFVVAAVDDPAVFIGAVPNLGSKPAAALAAFYLAGENAHAAVSAAVLRALHYLPLHHLEGGGVDDGGMALLNKVARHLPGILHHFLREEVRREGLLDARHACVLFVGKDTIDGLGIPLGSSRDRQDASLGQFLGDGAGCQPLDEQPEDEPHRLGLLLVDDEVAVLPFVVAEETGVAHGEFSVCHLFADAPSHILRNGAGFLLAK